jgi:monoamine oxidase
MDADIAIVGGGLSGLAIASGLGAGEWRLFEARDRLGGRILGRTDPLSGATFDMGPAWIWPHQVRLAKALRRFGLRSFHQYADGRLVFQDQTGAVRRDLDFAPMAGSLRVDGGLERLVEGFAAALPSDRVHRLHRLKAVRAERTGLRLEIATPDGTTIVHARRAVLALPPRLLSETVAFEPELPEEVLKAMARIPTWMAGHAKVVAVYADPFWRAQGLSGDAMSHLGPLAEIHDASPQDGSVGALFGFVGVPAPHREGREKEISTQALEQLSALFGPAAETPLRLFVKDWVADPMTATWRDRDPPGRHPVYGMPTELEGVWDGSLLFAGSEVAATEGGFLEGALEAADVALARLHADRTDFS